MNLVYWNNYYFTRDFQRYFETKYWPDTQDLTEYVNSSSDYKIAILGYPISSESLDQLLTCSERVFIILIELHDNHAAFIKQHNHEKITWVLPGVIYGIDNYVFNSEWLFEHVRLYSKPIIKRDLRELTPYETKPYYFDSLFKTYNPHKIFVHQQITSKHLTDKILMRSWQEDFIFPNELTEGHEASLTTYKGRHCLVASIVPINIYNQTAYSIITETQWNNSHFFLTEKITKCLLAKRLFVVFSGVHWLRSFRSLGFKTFDNIIDESYDSIEDPHLRWQRAFEQVEYLLGQDQEKILASAREVLEHNLEHLWTTNWQFIRDQAMLDQIDFNLS